MYLVTEHTRRKKTATLCAACRAPIDPGERYRSRVVIDEEWCADRFAVRVAHVECVGWLEGWELTPPPYQPRPVMPLSDALEAQARALTEKQVGKMAHALGWPQPYALRRSGSLEGHGLNSNHRNYYAGHVGDAAWAGAVALGLATSQPPRDGFPYTCWQVTETAKRCVWWRLQRAERGVE